MSLVDEFQTLHARAEADLEAVESPQGSQVDRYDRGVDEQ